MTFDAQDAGCLRIKRRRRYACIKPAGSALVSGLRPISPASTVPSMPEIVTTSGLRKQQTRRTSPQSRHGPSVTARSAAPYSRVALRARARRGATIPCTLTTVITTRSTTTLPAATSPPLSPAATEHCHVAGCLDHRDSLVLGSVRHGRSTPFRFGAVVNSTLVFTWRLTHNTLI